MEVGELYLYLFSSIGIVISLVTLVLASNDRRYKADREELVDLRAKYKAIRDTNTDLERENNRLYRRIDDMEREHARPPQNNWPQRGE